jgi:hypothetical protein
MDAIDHGARTQPINEVGDGAQQMPDVDVPNGPQVSPPCPALAAARFGRANPGANRRERLTTNPSQAAKDSDSAGSDALHSVRIK